MKVSAALLAAALLAGPAAADVTKKDKERARKAARYLVSQQATDGSLAEFSQIGDTADAVAVLVAARRAPGAIRKALDFLEASSEEANNIGLVAKVTLAAVAGSRDPGDFGGRDLIAVIDDSEQDDGRYGADTPVFFQALAILAQQAAGDDVSAQAVKWLADAQCDDGGWQFDEPAGDADDEHCVSGEGDFFPSDTNTTGLVVQALAGSQGPPPAVDPFAFFDATRDGRKKGWGYTFGSLTDTNSTALVIQAYVAEDEVLPRGAKRALRKLQLRFCNGRGAFAYTWADEDNDGKLERGGPSLGATIAAIPALVEQPFPIEARDVTKAAPRIRCG
jgi:hypothetical protein